jgi:hypothetical protein
VNRLDPASRSDVGKLSGENAHIIIPYAKKYMSSHMSSDETMAVGA